MKLLRREEKILSSRVTSRQKKIVVSRATSRLLLWWSQFEVRRHNTIYLIRLRGERFQPNLLLYSGMAGRKDSRCDPWFVKRIDSSVTTHCATISQIARTNLRLRKIENTRISRSLFLLPVKICRITNNAVHRINHSKVVFALLAQHYSSSAALFLI